MTHATVATNATARFALERLRISPELVGSKHQFFHEACRTTVTLPTPNPKIAPLDDRIRCDTWKSEGMIPLVYQVDSVDFEIELPGSVQIPEEMLKLPPNQYNLVNKNEQAELNARVHEAAKVLERAFLLWLRVLRWKSGIGYIGEPSVNHAGSGGSGALTDRRNGHRLWLKGGMVFAVGGKAVTSAEWVASQGALESNKQPPVWFEFLFEARMRINNKDLVGAVLTLAVAFEVNLRKIFSMPLEAFDVEPAVLQIVDLANLRALLTRLKKLRGWNEEWEAATDISMLHRLMDYRDGVMHSANIEKLSQAELRLMYGTVEKFAYFTTRALGLD